MASKYSIDKLNSGTLEQLQELCKSEGVPATGNKKTLVKALSSDDLSTAGMTADADDKYLLNREQLHWARSTVHRFIRKGNKATTENVAAALAPGVNFRTKGAGKDWSQAKIDEAVARLTVDARPGENMATCWF